MSDENSDMSRSFEQSRDTKQEKEIIERKTPDMIKNHKQEPELRPDWDVSDVDREHFERGSQKDIEKHAQKPREPDGFDKVDEARKWSERLGKDRDIGRTR